MTKAKAKKRMKRQNERKWRILFYRGDIVSGNDQYSISIMCVCVNILHESVMTMKYQ